MRIIGFSDASFAGNKDLTPQLEYNVLIGDGVSIIVSIFFKSYKAFRVTRPVVAAYLITDRDMLDVAFTPLEELESFHSPQNINLKLFTDNKTLFDVVSKGTETSKKG